MYVYMYIYIERESERDKEILLDNKQIEIDR